MPPVLDICNGAGINYQDIGDLPAGAEVTIRKVDGADVHAQIDAHKWITLTYTGDRDARMDAVNDGLQI